MPEFSINLGLREDRDGDFWFSEFKKDCAPDGALRVPETYLRCALMPFILLRLVLQQALILAFYYSENKTKVPQTTLERSRVCYRRSGLWGRWERPGRISPFMQRRGRLHTVTVLTEAGTKPPETSAHWHRSHWRNNTYWHLCLPQFMINKQTGYL